VLFTVSAIGAYGQGETAALENPAAAIAVKPDLALCEAWKEAAVADLVKQIDSVSADHKKAQKDRDKEQMKSLLEKKRQLSESLRKVRAKSPEDCWAAVLEERAKQKAAADEAARQRAVWEAADKAEQSRKEEAAKKAVADRKLVLRHRVEIKKGRNILTRAEFKELVRSGMSSSDVIKAVGSPDKTTESGDAKSFVYYGKTIDDVTGKDDSLVMVNFWEFKVRSVTFR
jgi:hypothetical protein